MHPRSEIHFNLQQKDSAAPSAVESFQDVKFCDLRRVNKKKHAM